jgi:hypothetical protein
MCKSCVDALFVQAPIALLQKICLIQVTYITMTSSTNFHSLDHFEDYLTVSVRKYCSIEAFERNNFFGGLPGIG